MLPLPPRSPLFPYTTLFRSNGDNPRYHLDRPDDALDLLTRDPARPADNRNGATRQQIERIIRSEEHTSELQSHVNIVCRLLLEKKKQNSEHLAMIIIKLCTH